LTIWGPYSFQAKTYYRVYGTKGETAECRSDGWIERNTGSGWVQKDHGVNEYTFEWPNGEATYEYWWTYRHDADTTTWTQGTYRISRSDRERSTSTTSAAFMFTQVRVLSKPKGKEV